MSRSGRPAPDLYQETPLAGISSDPEVYAALQGGVASTIRRNSENEQIVSVAVPVQRFKAVFGALVLSTEGGDIDRVVRAERSAIIVVFLIALLVSAGLSALLAGTIATPLRKLADAAAKSGASGKRAIDPERVGFPDYGDRADEIGYLSSALREMTGALYSRLAAIERFAADVAHEIKNPLTSLRSAVETFRLARTDAQRERLLAVIEHDVRRLDRLVTDISNASRVDAELSREEMRPVDIPALLDAVVSVTRDGAEAKEVRLTQSAQPQLSVQGLEGRLGQVLRNLVDNAISFSPAGGAVRIVAQRAPGGGVEIAVEDDGPGVPPDKLDAVFERFWSERPDADGFGDHSGLGLSISRQIVEAHGGRIAAGNRADPVTGETLGARFTVFLP
jgi:two-component system sensor histidine kinase ChvG